MRLLILFLMMELICISFVTIYAQEYKIFCTNPKRETLLLGGGFSLLAIGTFFYVRTIPPDPDYFDRKNIFSVDRFAVDLSYESTTLGSNITSALCVALPVLSVLSSRCRKTIREDLLMFSESGIFTLGLVMLSKSIFRRPRPYVYKSEKTQNYNLDKDAVRSFISGHTALAFNSAVFAGIVFQKRNPDSRWVKPIWIMGITTAAITAVFRVTSGNHFPTDVLAGAVVGSFGGWLIPCFHHCNHGGKGFSILLRNKVGISLNF